MRKNTLTSYRGREMQKERIEFLLNSWVNKKPNEVEWRYEAKQRILKCLTNKAELLDLSKLKISALPPSNLPIMPHVKTLNLSHNQLEFLPFGIHKSFPNLEELNLDGNKFVRIPDQVMFLSQLVVLSVKNNQLKWVGPEIANLRRLEQFLLQNNSQLKTIAPEIMQLPRLKTLFVIPEADESLEKELEEARAGMRRGSATLGPGVIEKTVNQSLQIPSRSASEPNLKRNSNFEAGIIQKDESSNPVLLGRSRSFLKKMKEIGEQAKGIFSRSGNFLDESKSSAKSGHERS